MPLLPADATTKKLKWSDFKTEQMDEPAAGKSIHAAYTRAGYVLTTMALA